MEPALPEAFDANELHEVLTVAIQSLDHSGGTPMRIPSHPIHAGVAAINLNHVLQDNNFVFEKDTWIIFLHFVTMTSPQMIHLSTSASLQFRDFRTHAINIEEEEPTMVSLEVLPLIIFLPLFLDSSS